LAAVTETKYIKRCLEQAAQYLGAACHESQNTKGSVFLKFHLPMKKKTKQNKTTTKKKTSKAGERRHCTL